MRHNHSKRILATQLLIIVVTILYIRQSLYSYYANTTDRIVEFVIFASALFFGLFLYRTIKEEVRQHEEIIDLTRRLRHTNWKLAIMNEHLQNLDKRKSEFVALVSHQLRAPVTAIKGYSSMLLEESYGKLAHGLKDPIERIFLSSKRLAEMVADFLDLSKIEQGTLSWYFASVDIVPIVTDLVTEYQTIAKKKNLELLVEYPKKETFIVTADEGKIRQIISNLIDNALTYTNKGGVHITVSKDTERRVVHVAIRDTGIGLSQEDIQNLFIKFSRGTRGKKQFTEGSGLGLFVAKKMLEAHNGGKLWVDSPGPGRGSTFTLELPLEGE